MSISFVRGKFYADRLDLNDWSPEEENNIRLLLANVYINSDTGKQLLDKIVTFTHYGSTWFDLNINSRP